MWNAGLLNSGVRLAAHLQGLVGYAALTDMPGSVPGTALWYDLLPSGVVRPRNIIKLSDDGFPWGHTVEPILWPYV